MATPPLASSSTSVQVPAEPSPPLRPTIFTRFSSTGIYQTMVRQDSFQRTASKLDATEEANRSPTTPSRITGDSRLSEIMAEVRAKAGMPPRGDAEQAKDEPLVRLFKWLKKKVRPSPATHNQTKGKQRGQVR